MFNKHEHFEKGKYKFKEKIRNKYSVKVYITELTKRPISTAKF